MCPNEFGQIFHKDQKAALMKDHTAFSKQNFFHILLKLLDRL